MDNKNQVSKLHRFTQTEPPLTFWPGHNQVFFMYILFIY